MTIVVSEFFFRVPVPANSNKIKKGTEFIARYPYLFLYNHYGFKNLFKSRFDGFNDVFGTKAEFFKEFYRRT